MKSGFGRALKVAIAMIAAFVISTLAPFEVSQFWPFIVMGAGAAVFFVTRPRVLAPAGVTVADTPSPIATSDTIRRGKVRLWSSVAIFVAAIAGIFLWSYLSSENERAEDLRYMVANKTQEMIGAKFAVESVSLPDGIGSYETIAVVVVNTVADGKRDSLTMVLNGNCDDVCRIRMDPADALRLGPFR